MDQQEQVTDLESSRATLATTCPAGVPHEQVMDPAVPRATHAAFSDHPSGWTSAPFRVYQREQVTDLESSRATRVQHGQVKDLEVSRATRVTDSNRASSWCISPGKGTLPGARDRGLEQVKDLVLSRATQAGTDDAKLSTLWQKGGQGSPPSSGPLPAMIPLTSRRDFCEICTRPAEHYCGVCPLLLCEGCTWTCELCSCRSCYECYMTHVHNADKLRAMGIQLGRRTNVLIKRAINIIICLKARAADP